eukprot:3280243-Amphidinium_carterae.3
MAPIVIKTHCTTSGRGFFEMRTGLSCTRCWAAEAGTQAKCDGTVGKSAGRGRRSRAWQTTVLVAAHHCQVCLNI